MTSMTDKRNKRTNIPIYLNFKLNNLSHQNPSNLKTE